jgi:NitT/TauT family transport system substrate-binding protein
MLVNEGGMVAMQKKFVMVAAVAAAAVVIAALFASGMFGGTARDASSGPGPWGTSGPGGSGGGKGTGRAGALAVRLGFVADVTQAPALVGLREGLFTAALRGTGLTLQPVPFRTDAAEADALASGRLDAAYSSTDSILAVLARPDGARISIVSGASAGGAELVVRSGITSRSGLRGSTVAVPAAAGAQVAALRSWLAARQIGTGRGAITLAAVAPDAVVREFKAGRISGAWMPAPYDVELAEAGGRVLASEDAMPPGSRPAAVNLVVTRTFESAHSAALLALVKAQVQVNDIVNHDLLLTATAVNAELAALSSGRLPVSVLGASLAQITFTDDPGAASLMAQAPSGQNASVAAVLPTLYDIAPLNLILRMAGERPVSA